MSPIEVLAWGAAGAIAFLVALWAAQLRTGDAGVSDFGWALALGGLAVLYAILLDAGEPSRRALVATLAGAWAARLAGHLLFDRVLPPGEDGRWAAVRERLGERAGLLFLPVFLLQGALAVVLSGAFLLAMALPQEPLGALDAAAAAIVLLSVAGETTADRQLARFRADPANHGRVCRDGLWAWSRHPNYFFEWTFWLAWPVMAAGAPRGWTVLFAPALMLVFITRLSGIPPTERQALRSRGAAYREYQRTTSAFFPWPPR